MIFRRPLDTSLTGCFLHPPGQVAGLSYIGEQDRQWMCNHSRSLLNHRCIIDQVAVKLFSFDAELVEEVDAFIAIDAFVFGV